MWFEDLGPVLEPLLSDLVREIRVRPLTLWVLRTDGRHFLEEAPPISRSAQAAFVPETRGSSGTFPVHSFEQAEIIDPHLAPTQTLVLEAVYPEVTRFPIGTPRDLAPEGCFQEALSPDNPPAVPVRFSADVPAIPDCLSGREGWLCRLQIAEQVIGFIGIPAEAGENVSLLFPEVWRRQTDRWRNLQMESSLARRTWILQAVLAVGNTITSQLEIHDVLQSVVEQATVLMRAKVASLMLVDEANRRLSLESVYGSTPDYIRKPDLDIDHSLLGRVVREGHPLVVQDVRSCDEYAHRDLARNEGLVSLLSVPMKWQGACMGVLNVYSAHRYRYTTDNVYLLSMMASQSAIAIQNARTLNRMRVLEDQVHELDKRSLIGELAASVAHEIRNPLSAVKMLIESWEPSDEGQQRDLNVISTQLEGINRCVTDLLETARPRIPGFQQVRLEEEITTTLQMLRVRIRDQGVQTQLEITSNLPAVRVDAPRFRQLLINLLLNALNAMPESGTLRVRLEQVPTARLRSLPGTTIVGSEDSGKGTDENAGESVSVLLTLSDSGGGIPEEDLGQIFEPFKSRRREGFGLGLSVVKRVAEEHGCLLRVLNEPGRGLTYFISFPVVRDETGKANC